LTPLFRKAFSVLFSTRCPFSFVAGLPHADSFAA
jgi:hypothetical protein